MRNLSVLFLTFNLINAFSLPFSWDFFLPGSAHSLSSKVQPHRIAIIGAGAGGSSAAFWVAKAKQRAGVSVEVDVFERENYVGGRTFTCLTFREWFVFTGRVIDRQHRGLSLQRYNLQPH